MTRRREKKGIINYVSLVSLIALIIYSFTIGAGRTSDLLTCYVTEFNKINQLILVFLCLKQVGQSIPMV